MEAKEIANNVVKKLKINADMCIWCGACVAVTSEYGLIEFGMDGKAVVVNQPTNDKELESAQEAIDACCVAAISWDE